MGAGMGAGLSADLGAPLSDGSILLPPPPARRRRLRSGPRHTNTHTAMRTRATPPEIRPRFRGSLRKSSFSGASPNLGELSGGGGDDGGGGGDDGGGGATASGMGTWVSTVTADVALTVTPRELKISLGLEAISALAEALTASAVALLLTGPLLGMVSVMESSTLPAEMRTLVTQIGRLQLSVVLSVSVIAIIRVTL